MIISVWRYSHFALAVSSFLLLTLASITGIVLSFEPVMEKSKGFRADGFDSVNLARVIPVVKKQFKGVQRLAVDDNDYVTLSFTNKAGDIEKAYIHPVTGAVLGKPQEQSAFFKWVTSLHRSLFLHETGRLIMGITAFLLILIVLSGIILVARRQKSLWRFFAPVEKTGFAQYYHVLFGRIALFPMLAIALTATCISMARLGFINTKKTNAKADIDNIKEEPERALKDFVLFQQTRLSQVEAVEFPFSDFPEDYYTLKLKDRELCVNQFTGDKLAEQLYPKGYALNNFSMRWHTGRSGSVWAIVLAVTAAYILFFIYSGFVITIKRRANRARNQFKPADSRIVILVGSENGSTFQFAQSIYKQLLKHGERVCITDLSKYTVFPKAEHLVIMTSTYGLGDPPSNAVHFAERLIKYPQMQPTQFSVVGFGSRTYPQFCQFAYDVDALLRQQSWATAVTEVFTVDDRSPQDFSAWLTNWSHQTGCAVTLSRELLEGQQQELTKLKVVHKTAVDDNETFMIRLQADVHKTVQSGDLLAIYPKNDHRERLYSIGKIGKEVQLSIKLHEKGLGSGFLHALTVGDSIQAKIVKNKHFNFPAKAKQIVLIANGTGIAPLLGMIAENKKKQDCYLYAGFRTEAAFELYKPSIQDSLATGQLKQYQLATSREGNRQYVSDLVLKDQELIGDVLANGGVLMLCGSLAMQKDVLEVLEQICQVKKYQAQGQILTDCY